ncbi:MAG: TolC family protein [Nitrospirae bacterium]|nr:MAG: TolC family protein [Nitrospirota bacterium]
MGRKMVVLVAITVGLLMGERGGVAGLADEPKAPQALPEVLTLERSMELALSNHPSLRVASGNQAIQEAQVGQAQAGFYPQVQGSLGYNRRTTNSTSTFQGSRVGRSTAGDMTGFYSSSVTLNQLLYDFGTTNSRVEAQQFQFQAANSDAQTAVQTVVINVQQAYFSLQQAQRLVSVSEEAITQFEKHLDLAKGRFKAGVAPKIDVTTAEVDRSNAQLNLITARNNALVARVTLNNAMGIQTTKQYRVQDPVQAEPYRVSLDEAVAKAMRLRPEMISQRAQEQAAEAAIKAAQGNFFPTVTSSANYSYSATDFPLVWNWSLGGTVSVPIFSGFLTQQQVAQARATLLTTKANGDVLRQTILLDVNQASLNLEAAWEKLRVTAVTVDQAKERLALVEGRYKAGLSTAVEVTDAEVALVSAQVNDVVAVSSYQAAKAALDKAMGIITPVRGGS